MNNIYYKDKFVKNVYVRNRVVNLSMKVKILKKCCRFKENGLTSNKGINKNSNYILKKQKFMRKEEINDKRYYANNIRKLRYQLDRAYQQMQQGQYFYAIYDAKNVMSEAIKILLRYKNRGYTMDDLLMNIKICERKKLLGTDKYFISRLYEVYHICECKEQIFNKEKYINYRKVHFAIMQLKDLLNFVEREINYC